MRTKDLHQTVVFPTTAADLYDCLLDERKHSSFTGSPASISDREGAAFTCFDGYITGKNILLERPGKIVQRWRAEEPEWPADHFSETAFVITEIPDGCRVDLFHTDVPEAVAERIDKGWHTYYWEPLLFYLNR